MKSEINNINDAKKEVKTTIKAVKCDFDIKKIDELQNKLMQKIFDESGDIDNIDKYIDLYDKLDKIKNKTQKQQNKQQNKENKQNIGHRNIFNCNDWINTKEDAQALKGLTLGNELFEDWHLSRILLRVKIVDMMLPKRE